MDPELYKEVNSAVYRSTGKIFAVYMSVLVAFFVLMFGWHQASINNIRSDIDEVKTKVNAIEGDLGYMNGALRERFHDAIVFEALYDKYTRTRRIVR
jgi:hypothetical protein